MSTPELTVVHAPRPSSPRHDAAWLRAARQARLLSWFSLAWMTIEGAVGVIAGLVAGSVALLGFGLDSAIEGAASVIVIWRLPWPPRCSPDCWPTPCLASGGWIPSRRCSSPASLSARGARRGAARAAVRFADIVASDDRAAMSCPPTSSESQRVRDIFQRDAPK